MVVEEEPMDEAIQDIPAAEDDWLHYKAPQARLWQVERRLGQPLSLVQHMGEDEEPDGVRKEDEEHDDGGDQVGFVGEVEGEGCSQLGAAAEGKVQGVVGEEAEGEEPHQGVALELRQQQLDCGVGDAPDEGPEARFEEEEEEDLLDEALDVQGLRVLQEVHGEVALVKVVDDWVVLLIAARVEAEGLRQVSFLESSDQVQVHFLVIDKEQVPQEYPHPLIVFMLVVGVVVEVLQPDHPRQHELHVQPQCGDAYYLFRHLHYYLPACIHCIHWLLWFRCWLCWLCRVWSSLVVNGVEEDGGGA